MSNWIARIALFVLLLPALGMAAPVNVNTADAETLSESLRGVGPSKARAIIEYREKHGPFRSPDDLSLVKGIGERTVEMNRKDILVAPAAKP